MARWSLRAPRWAWTVTAITIAAMTALGLWQLRRGDAKKILIQELLQAQTRAPQRPDPVPDAQADTFLHLVVAGQYDTQRQVLEDNQALDGRPGFHVWTPLRTRSGQVVVVDRGWVAAKADRSADADLAAPDGDVEVDGLWRALPQPGMRLFPSQCIAGDWPRIVQYPDVTSLTCTLGEPVAAGLLLLDPLARGGYERRWQITPQMPPERHYAYALQWFAMALAVLVLFVKLNLRRNVR